MARSGAMKHTHKYFRLFSDRLWHCGHPSCTHYMPSNMPEPVWKDSICWECGNRFQLTPDNMESDHPVCDTCPSYAKGKSGFVINDEINQAIEKNLREAQRKRDIKTDMPITFLPTEPDVLEIIDDSPLPKVGDHMSYCDTWNNGPCNCGVDE